jgi:hypothetical protein
MNLWISLLENLDGGEDGGHVDTADSITRGNENSDVALLTPVCAPGVLDDPVLATGFYTIANKENSMIKVRLADIDRVDDARGILEPGIVSGADTN